MPLKRVVITGMGAISPFGRGVDTLMNALLLGESGVRILPELADIRGIRTRVAALVPGVDPGEIPRKYRRSMSAMSVFAALAAGDAIAQAGLSGNRSAVEGWACPSARRSAVPERPRRFSMISEPTTASSG